MDLLQAALIERLRVHPRVSQQGLALDPSGRERLAAAVPAIVPFRGRTPHQIVALLDWDHRLPSRRLYLRLHVFYGAPSLARFESAVTDRLVELKRRDLFPEFDVPDLGDLPGDESYDAELTVELAVESIRLVSAWRRDVALDVGDAAVRAVRGSAEFAEARAAEPGRPSHLGDLEAVGWTPPCESGQPGWTIDVWWLTAFDGRHGRGWSFLVDPEPPPPRVLAHREFTVRTA